MNKILTLLLFVIISFSTIGQETTEYVILGGIQDDNPTINNILSDAISDLNNDGTITIKGDIILNSNDTIPKGIVLNFFKGNKIILKNNAKLLIEGDIQAGAYQIFDVTQVANDAQTSMEYNITFSNPKTFYPEWWGILPGELNNENRITLHRINKQMMLDIKSSGGGHLHFSSGTYYIRDLVVDFSNLRITGNGTSTILKYDKNYDSTKTSTRQGAIIVIRGSLKEKFSVNGTFYNITGNWLWSNDSQIENIIFKDIAIEYFEKEQGPFNHLLNGIVIMNAKNVLVENVTVNLQGANRGFYIGANSDQEKTENIIIRNCSTRKSLSGVYILNGWTPTGGLEPGVVREGKVIRNITIENCSFNVDRSLERTDSEKFSSGIFLNGSEKTVDPYCKLGKITLNNNYVENADFGIRTAITKNTDQQYYYDIYIKGNTFYNFKITGIFGLFKKGYIIENVFDTDALDVLEQEFSNSDYKNAAINIIKRKDSYEGIDFLSIQNNIFRNLSQKPDNNSITPSTISIIPGNSAMIHINNNYFSYENGKLPISDITLTIDKAIYQNEFGLLNYSDNKYANRSNNNYVTLEGTNLSSFTLKDLGNYYYGN